jgi:sec-independent protein translocase protein TatC
VIKQLLLRILRGKNAGGLNLDQKEMSFLDHLEELRWHVVKALAGLAIGMILCGIFAEFIVQKILLAPLLAVGLKAQVLAPYGIVMLYIQAALVSGFILSMPNTLYWLWKFIAPGLMPNERRYFVLVPTALTFFAGFGTANISLNIAVDRYITFLLALVLGTGLVFELPMLSYFLAKLGIMSAEFMRKYRRHAYVVILLIAGIVTPTPDMVTQLLMASPMFVLYEVSIFIAKFVYKKKEKEKEQQATEEDVSGSDDEGW